MPGEKRNVRFKIVSRAYGRHVVSQTFRESLPALQALEDGGGCGCENVVEFWEDSQGKRHQCTWDNTQNAD